MAPVGNEIGQSFVILAQQGREKYAQKIKARVRGRFKKGQVGHRSNHLIKTIFLLPLPTSLPKTAKYTPDGTDSPRSLFPAQVA